ncbi:MAG TPA: M28 family peptidase [Candidatus Baltobacteraceae bacterium]|nr:M28 family peptidase [Candidatus Baltobacteraceae bacterium]
MPQLRRPSILLALLLAAGAVARADVPAPPIDPVVARAIAGISPARLRALDTRLVAFGTRSALSDRETRPGRGVFAARAWLVAQLRDIARASGGRMTVALDSYDQPADPKKRVPRPTVISSVIATIKGDDPTGRTVVMSSHYDSRVTDLNDAVHDAPGADDNGSGTSAILEAARALAPIPMHANVVFAIFDGEEQGLLGSAHYAKVLKDAGVPVEADLNNDIVGASVGDDGVKRDGELRIFSEAIPAGANVARLNAIGAENDSPSRELARYAKETGDAYVPDLRGTLVFRADRFLRGSDHESFNANGYAALRFTEPRENFAHQHQDVRVENGVQYGDLLQFVDFDYLAKVARYNAAVLASLALAPAPPDPKIDITKLTNDTTLFWDVVPRATHYLVLRRRTTDAQWTEAQDAGDATRVTLPYSKDNWQFGLASVDAQGHRSLAVFPTPAR